MAKINVSYSGNGVAYIDDPNPEPNQQVTLTATADPGATLDDIVATDQHGYSIALSVQPSQTFRYNSAWGNISIVVTFSGGGPTPPGPGSFNMWWLLKKIAEKNSCLYN